MHDFYFKLENQHLEDLNVLSLYSRLEKILQFNIESPLKLLKEEGNPLKITPNRKTRSIL